MDAKLLDSLKERSAKEAERKAIIEEGHLPALAELLVTEDEDNALVLPALEVLFYLSTEGALRPKIASVDGLLQNVQKFISRGRLKQKKVALMTYKNLQLAAPASREDIMSPFSPLPAKTESHFPAEGDEENSNMNSTNNPLAAGATDGLSSPSLLLAKKKGRIVNPAMGARLRPQHPVAATPSAPSATVPIPGQATTINLFVEGMHSTEARTQVEQALLKREGVISFFSDIAEEKIVIRTTLTADDLYAHVWENCKMRCSTVKGDYSNFKPSGYLDENGNKGGWLWGISSLLQIIAVKPNEKEVPPTPAKTPAKPKPTATAGNGQQGWLGSWW